MKYLQEPTQPDLTDSLLLSPVFHLNPVGSINVVVNDTACVFHERRQIRFPKSKKKRIRKKWSKRSCNWKVFKMQRIIKMPDKILVSSETYELIKMLP